MNVGDTIPITIGNKNYGEFVIDFLLIEMRDEIDRIYFAYAQGRVAKVQYKVDGKWYILNDVDILDLLN